MDLFLSVLLLQGAYKAAAAGTSECHPEYPGNNTLCTLYCQEDDATTTLCTFPLPCVNECDCVGGGCDMNDCLQDCRCPDGGCKMDICMSGCVNPVIQEPTTAPVISEPTDTPTLKPANRNPVNVEPDTVKPEATDASPPTITPTFRPTITAISRASFCSVHFFASMAITLLVPYLLR